MYSSSCSSNGFPTSMIDNFTFLYSEFKRREKLRAKEAAKAAKAAAAPAKEATPKEKSAEEGEEELNPNVRSNHI